MWTFKASMLDFTASMWDVTGATWAVTGDIWTVIASMWAVTVSTWAFIASIWAVHPLCGLLHFFREWEKSIRLNTKNTYLLNYNFYTTSRILSRLQIAVHSY